MSDKLVSIIIPTCNRAHLISETLDSIIAQTYINWECIIVDDGSIDNTATLIDDYIKKDNRFQYHQRPADRVKGANACRNYGFEVSKGDFIKWFDSDDMLLTNCIEKQIATLESFDVSVCQIMKYDFEKNKILGISQINSEELIQDYLIGRVIFYISSPLWNRKFIQKQSVLFDEAISNLDDWDFNLRMLYEQPKIQFIEEPLIKYRIHKDSLSHDLEKLNRKEIASELNARDKHIELLKQKNDLNYIVLKKHTKNRLKYFLRESLMQSDTNSSIYYFELIKRQFKLLDWFGGCKISVAFVSYKFFRKGYKLLK